MKRLRNIQVQNTQYHWSDIWPSLDSLVDDLVTATEDDCISSRGMLGPWGGRSHDRWAMFKQYRDQRNDWSGATFPEAVRLSREGMHADQETIDFRDKLITVVAPARNEIAHWDVTGASVDVGAYNTGVPECMLNFEEREGRKRNHVAIRVTLATSASLDAKAMKRRGAAIMAVVDALEMSRLFTTSLYIGDTSPVSMTGGKVGEEMCVRVKDPGHDYDPHVVRFCLVEPAFYRRFTWMAQALVSPIFEAYGVGSIGPYKHGLPDESPEAVYDLDSWVYSPDGMSGNPFCTDERCIEWTKQQLEKINSKSYTENGLAREGII